MRKPFALFAAAVMITACAGKGTVCQRIAPLPAGYSTENLSDCTFPAAFTADDFNWRGSNLTLTLYEEAFYDAARIGGMKQGDTLVFDARDIVVESIVRDGDYLTVNGGVEEGGAYLQASKGGTWRGATFDDHSIYREMGEVELILDDGFRIITNINKEEGNLDPETAEFLRLDEKTADLYHLLCGEDIYSASDRVRRPYIE